MTNIFVELLPPFFSPHVVYKYIKVQLFGFTYFLFLLSRIPGNYIHCSKSLE